MDNAGGLEILIHMCGCNGPKLVVGEILDDMAYNGGEELNVMSVNLRQTQFCWSFTCHYVLKIVLETYNNKLFHKYEWFTSDS